MITDSYDIETEPMINLFDFYGRRGDFADICLIIFSKEIHRHLLDSYESEIIATMSACNGDTHIYKTPLQTQVNSLMLLIRLKKQKNILL